MTEQEIVEKTYESTIQQMCSQLFSMLLISQDATEREKAEQIFRHGVNTAREVRDRAKQLLP
jgi:hypothetical protein